MSSRAAIWLFSGAVLGAAALSACAQIPTSGPITQDEQVQASIDEPLIRVLARGPEPGLSPEQVVEGFISAEASFEDDHGTARQYLTEDASAAWDPNAGVVVIDDAPAPDFEQFHRVVKMTANEVAFIGADGSLEPRSGGAFHDHFVLQRSDGEWRIAQLRDGLYLTRLDVARTYRSFALHFLAPGQQRLVPDPVFVPVDQSGAATSLVRSLLDGPTRWLAPAVQTAVPAGTELVVDSVPIENGVAQVDLSAQALTADDVGREQLAAQLVWTLTELPDVTEVEITVEGSPFQIPGVPLVQDEATWEQYNPNGLPDSAVGVIVRRGMIRQIDGRHSRPIAGPLGNGRFVVRDPAISPDGGLVAALSTDRSRAVAEQRFPTAQLKTLATGQNWAAPSIDGSDTIWLADRTQQGTRIWLRPSDGKLERVTAPSLRHRRVVAIRAALDGTRVAILLRGADGKGQLLLARVVAGSSDLELQALRPLEDQLTDVRDMTWSSASSIIALARDRGSALQPLQIGIDGSVDPVAGTFRQGINGLAMAPGFALLASTTDGEIYRNGRVAWQPLMRGRDPAYPG